MMRRAAILLAALLVAALVAGDARPAAGQTPGPTGPQPQGTPPAPFPKHPKFSTSIALVADAAAEVPAAVPMSAGALAAAYPSLQAYFDAGLLKLDGAGRLQVYIHVAALDQAARDGLVALGAALEQEDPERRVFQASVPLRALAGLANLKYVTAVTAPSYGHVNAGSKLTEGDGLLGFGALRALQGLNGSGVTVGVISDGLLGLASSVASGDLPPTTLVRDGTGKLVSTTGGVIATSFRADGNLEGGLGGSPTGAEGTAILEIIHDIAPGAQLRFANFSTDLEFMAAVDFLAANSDVVIDDIGFFGKPYDQTSNVSTNTATELNRPTNRIRGYFTSVGNGALKHYQGLYTLSTLDGTSLGGPAGKFHLFSATPGTTDALGLGPRPFNPVFLRIGERLEVLLVWDDVFGAATTDYDLVLVRDSTSAVVAVSTDDNIGVTREPVEVLAFVNSTGTAQFFDILIQNFNNASPPKTFDLFVLGGLELTANGSNLNYNTTGSSVSAQSDAGGGVVSVGAISAADPGTDDIEPFSSRGPTNNGVMKPDVAAVDRVAVTGSGGFPSPFSGTSAAAPHVAGLAALLLQLRPDLKAGEPGDNPAADRAALRAAIVGTAVDLGPAGPDNTFGSGRVNGLNAAAPLLVPPVVEAGPDLAAPEGTQVLLSAAAFTDLNPTDTHVATVSWGDGATGIGAVDATKKIKFDPHAYADNGTYTVTVTVTDDDGKAGSDTLKVTVANVAPVVEAGPNSTAVEGATVSLGPATFTDAGVQDTHAATIAWGDGVVTAGAVNQTAGTVSGSHVYGDNGAFTVTVTVTDDDGGSNSDIFTVTVSNTAPAVAAGPDRTVAEGDPAALILATFTDAGAKDTHTATIAWGDGAVTAGGINQSAGAVSGSHTYADNGTFTVTVTVTDDDGSAASATLKVTVNNAAPLVEAGPNRTVSQYTAVGLDSATFTDPGLGDTHTAIINWGDGLPQPRGVITEPTATSPGTVRGSRIFTTPGTFTVTVVVTDDDGASHTASFTLTVQPGPAPIPAATPWALGALAGAFVLLSTWALRRQAQGERA